MVDVFDISHIPIEQLIAYFSSQPGFIWLDSSDTHHKDARFSYMASAPIDSIDSTSPASFGEFLNRWVPSFQIDGPFCGFVAGYLGYESGHYSNPGAYKSVLKRMDIRYPDYWLGVYPVVVRQDHLTNVSELIVNTHLHRQASAEIVRQLETIPPHIPSSAAIRDMKESMTKSEFIDSVKHVQFYIEAGDIYQLNLTRRIDATLLGTPLDLYLAMRRTNPAPYGAYIATPHVDILSMSPELFFKIQNMTIETRPIKGTIPRSYNNDFDISQLYHSEKDTAELIMIVDLLRNDISKICKPGSVQVPRLKEVESYSNLHHLVATVRGTLPPTTSAIDVIRALFPGGSITGAPKRRAMELIREIEPIHRGIYTGNIGYFGFNGESRFNIAIRTAIHAAGNISYNTGCGIVADSSPESEWNESKTKAMAFEKHAQSSPH